MAEFEVILRRIEQMVRNNEDRIELTNEAARILLDGIYTYRRLKATIEQQAKWRREVLEEAVEQFADHDFANYYGSHIKATLRRMAEQQ